MLVRHLVVHVRCWHWERVVLEFVHRWVLPRWGEVGEVRGVELLRCEVRERLWWVVAELEWLLVLLLHWVEHVVLWVAGGILLMLLSTEVAIDVAFLAGDAANLLLITGRRDDLNVAVIRQKFHVRRAVKENFSWNRRQRVCQVSQLVISVSEAAIVLELADAGLLVVAAHLSLVIRVHSTDVVTAGIIDGHSLNKKKQAGKFEP